MTTRKERKVVTVPFADLVHRVRIRVTSGAAIVTLDAATQYLPEEEALLARTA